MAIVAVAKSGNSNPIPEGVYRAVCIRIIDLGDQFSEKYGNSSRKVSIMWELPDETIDIDGVPKPKMISKEYTLSLSEKATLRQHLENWRGKKFTDEELNGFDLGKVLGAACQIQVLHNANGYANVAAIMALPKGMEAPTPATDKIYFDLSSDECLAQLENLPEWIRDKIKKSPQYIAMVSGQSDSDDGFTDIEDEELPF